MPASIVFLGGREGGRHNIPGAAHFGADVSAGDSRHERTIDQTAELNNEPAQRCGVVVVCV